MTGSAKTFDSPGEVAVTVGAFELLAEPRARVDSGGDSHRDSPQVVVRKLLLEIDAVTVASGGSCLSSPARSPLVGTQLTRGKGLATAQT